AMRRTREEPRRMPFGELRPLVRHSGDGKTRLRAAGDPWYLHAPLKPRGVGRRALAADRIPWNWDLPDEVTR
ncbi:MAG: hypothetical protein KDB23_15015, partial [Planctomycetales bacterium]|nr:hypothetical protein [Planctomycetales bacterium]